MPSVQRMIRALGQGLLLLGFAIFDLSALADSVWVSELQNEVTRGQVDKIKEDLVAAEKTGAALFVLRIDTPGGEMEATRILVQAILDSPVPVAAYVAPAGARASSAGTYILSAAHIAAMSPATNIGSAKPIVLSFGDVDEDMKQKFQNDAAAQLRALAQLRGRNAEWLTESVTKAENITSSEALELGVIDLIAVNQNDLLKQLNGRSVSLGDAELVLDTQNLEPVSSKPFENFSWVTIWLLFGIGLIVLELVLTSFISLFFGIGALITSLALSLGLPDTGWPVWTVFILSSVVLLFGTRARFKQYFVGDEEGPEYSELDASYLGQRVRYVSGFTETDPGEGLVEFRGSNWRARTERAPLDHSGHWVIVNVESNTLWVEEKSNG
ncbi:MAG: NfeD family protein [Pseudomonadales bacterium]